MMAFVMNYAIRTIEKELAEHADEIQDAFLDEIRKLSDMLVAYLDEKAGIKDEMPKQID
jgi:hypothetical protein